MHRRLWLSVAMLVAGASLLVAASFASAAGNHASAAAKGKKGGIWKTYYTQEEADIDPQVGYDTLIWAFEYATAAKLLNYPDKAGNAGTRLVPEVASRYTVSKSGKTYTFYLRKNFKFSNGTKVTAKNFVYAFKRTLSKKLSSPGASFIQDPASTFVRSYRAKGKYKFIVKLKKASGLFLTEMAMPFFQATPTSIPLNKPIGNVTSPNKWPSAGPYHVVFSDPTKLTAIRRNKFYKPGTAGHHRPRNLSGWQISYNVNAASGELATQKGQYAEGAPLPEDTAKFKKQCGVNKSCLYSKPTTCQLWIPLNTQGPAFSGNVALRHAMNEGLNRSAYTHAPGPLAGAPWDHILPPGFPGFFSKAVWPRSGQHYAAARRLAKGHYKNHKLTIWYRNTGVTGPKQKLLINRDLRFLGYTPSQLNYRGFNGQDLYDGIGASANKHKFDMALSVGWCEDYPDPYDYLNKLFTPSGIQTAHGDNWAFFSNPKWTAKMNHAARLTGGARLTAYRKIDKGLTAGPAPIASMYNARNVYLFSKKVNHKCLVYQGVYTDWDITALCLK